MTAQIKQAKRQKNGKRLFTQLRYLLGLPFAGIALLLRIRLLKLSVPSAIGHFAAETDFFIRSWRRGDYGRIVPILILRRTSNVNKALVTKLADQIFIIQNRFAIGLMRTLSPYSFLHLDLRHVVMTESECPYHRLRAETAHMPPSLILSEAEKAECRKRLATIGVPVDRWLVAIHARESGFYGDRFSYRNASLASYLSAIDEIVMRGGWCLRMGDQTMSTAPEHYGLTDYAHSSLKSHLMDVLICGSSRFFLGCASGLSIVPTLFGKPTVVVHMAPLGATLPPDADSIAIPMLMHYGDMRILKFSEMAALELKNDVSDELLCKINVKMIASHPADIRDACVEMMARLDGGWVSDSVEEKLQERFRSHLTNRDYCLHSAARISGAFLRKYESLL